MIYRTRILLAVLILIVDSLLFFIPLTAFFLIYILLFNPAWFRIFLIDTYEHDKNGQK